MARTYGAVNLVSSFGFAARWRDLAIAALPAATPRRRVADLMSGMGELWRSLARLTPDVREVVAVDLSAEMLRRASVPENLLVTCRVEDVLHTDLEPASFDVVVSTFGLKTFDSGQQERLAHVVAELLRSGGSYSFLEISVPRAAMLRRPYLFYIDRVIPIVGRLFLGNPENYRLLGAYTHAFGDCRHFAACLASAGLTTELRSHTFGCATGVVGRKP